MKIWRFNKAKLENHNIAKATGLTVCYCFSFVKFPSTSNTPLY